MSTISDAIKKDHGELRYYYNEVIQSDDHDHQQRFGNQFTWELARHSVGEELIVYPAFEKYLDTKGHDVAEHDRKDHHKVGDTCSSLEIYQHFVLTEDRSKKTSKVFQGLKPQDRDYVPQLKELWADLEKHVVEEESNGLPLLDSAMDKANADSEALAKSFERTKMFIPTRSHPSAGESPGFESVMGLLTAPIDRLADVFRKFPDRGKIKTPDIGAGQRGKTFDPEKPV